MYDWNKEDPNATIRCDCDNRFRPFDKSKQWRLMSCIKCRKMFWIKCSGRRLVDADETAIVQMEEQLRPKQQI